MAHPTHRCCCNRCPGNKYSPSQQFCNCSQTKLKKTRKQEQLQDNLCHRAAPRKALAQAVSEHPCVHVYLHVVDDNLGRKNSVQKTLSSDSEEEGEYWGSREGRI